MSVSPPTSRERASVPEIGRWVPTAALRLLLLAVAGGLCVLVLESPFWVALGLALAAATTLAPKLVPVWWLVLLLSVSQLWRQPSSTDYVYYLLLGGAHLLFVLGGVARLLPWNGRLQLVAVARPLRRFALVQAVVQPLAAVALVAFGGGRGTTQGLSILSAVALGLLAAMLAKGLRQAKSGA